MKRAHRRSVSSLINDGCKSDNPQSEEPGDAKRLLHGCAEACDKDERFLSSDASPVADACSLDPFGELCRTHLETERQQSDTTYWKMEQAWAEEVERRPATHAENLRLLEFKGFEIDG